MKLSEVEWDAIYPAVKIGDRKWGCPVRGVDGYFLGYAARMPNSDNDAERIEFWKYEE